MGSNRSAGKRPSMFEVAKLAGVSHQTVSRVINNSPDVSDATRAKVQAAIKQLDYHPSNSARALASRRSRTIGLIAGGMRFFGPISAISSIETVARQHGLFMSVMMVHEALCTQREFEELCGTFNEQNVDAFIFLTPTDVMFEAACRTQVSQPRVFVTSTHGALGMSEGLRLIRSRNHGRVSMVGIDQWGAMAEIVRLLGEYGHRRALYFAGPSEWRDASTRLDAWVKLTRAKAISSVTVRCETWDSAEAYGRMNHLLDSIGQSGGALPSVVVCANDSQAVGVARALHEHDVRIPQDVSLVGFDDMPAMDNMYPPLTTVRPDFEQLGSVAMREVLHLLGEGDEVAFAASSHGVGLIPAKVINRSSLGPTTRR
ncbi:LacI family transcriptional regulator [Bifidobacterium ramosum]|uniref:LacI family DNA-binding transcriptional regulator n=2 Tax=Bifidobacterium ramosum TaxID=1798158 RepID=A0A6L4X2A9_9BIFI|nr:LacI family DNA-binding transcriptional regulator [Bifidobacterium ramosum]KAB8288744.1 LacI family transcriptional regulator [Bifidobacterium ramosum]NEG71393.1 LacI family DNA-binding transcriptional regulator [Bifidobacterium ramosum]